MNNMKIVIASDHGGFNLKNKIYTHLKEKGYDINDLGTNSLESCDYPDYAKKVVDEVLNSTNTKGILVCGTGIGMQIAANRHKGIRAACVSDTYSARMTREHNDSNVLTLGERTVGAGLALDIVEIWLTTEFAGGRHLKRINKLDE